MLKILHTSDWHLGHTLYDHDRSEEQENCMNQIIDIARQNKPDAIVVSGDIFDKYNPSQTARDLFIRTLISLRQALPHCAIIVTAGNHDGKLLLDNDGKIFALGNITVIGQVQRHANGSIDFNRHIITVRDAEGTEKGLVVAMPHIYDGGYPTVSNEEGDRMRLFYDALFATVEQRNPSNLPVVLSAHIFLSGSDISGHSSDDYSGRVIVGSCESIKQDQLAGGYDYLALGHIHSPQDVRGSNPLARYCGTPIPLDFDELGDHGVSIVTIDSHGSLPQVEHVTIHNPMPLITFPDRPTTFTKAMADLIDFPNNQACYLRLNVLDDTPMPPDYRTKINNLLKDKKAQYCTIKHTSNIINNGKDTTEGTITLNPQQMPSPAELAQQYYKKKYGLDMPAEMLDCLRQAIDAATVVNLGQE